MTDIEKIRKSLKLSEEFVRFKGGMWRVKLYQSALVQKIYDFLRIDLITIPRSEAWNDEITKAFQIYLSKEEREDEFLLKALKKDINDCFRYTLARPYEYFLFDFRNKSKNERKKYVTDKYYLRVLSQMGQRRYHDLELNDKYNFYLLTQPYFKRKALKIDSRTTFSEVKDFLVSRKLIFKSIYLGCGMDIFIKDITSEFEAKKVFEEIKGYGGCWIVEELIVQSDEMASWNESCVNTIRINSFMTKEGIKWIYPLIRTGRPGSYVDNGGAGGIRAVIDIESGKIRTDGYDENGKSYSNHPNSGIRYKGWQVPRWHELLKTVEEIHTTIFPHHKYIGWDFAFTDKGWVLIEGNWGQFLGSQQISGEGLKVQFDNYVKM